ncbi:MAG: hypothetical protein ACR2LN_07770 [Candidatus Levyibacteriota bacterium]
MKLSLLFFFAFTNPLVLFFAILLYGGIPPDNMKKAIADSEAYSQVSAHFAQQDADTITQNKDFTVIVSKRLTPTYIRTKTESVIDESATWITGKTQTVPVVSFRELKEELQSEHSDLMGNIEHIPTAVELKRSDLDAQNQTRYLEQAKQITAFTNDDFTLPLGNQLEGIKLAYRILQIALPMLIVLLICSLFLLVKFAYSLPSRFKWVGAALLASSIVGYGCIFFHPYITPVIIRTNILQQSDFFSLFSPIIIAMINHYVEIYIGYQEIVNTVFLVGAAGCFLGAIATRKQAIPKLKPVYEIRSYWETPLKEKPTPPSEEYTDTK